MPVIWRHYGSDEPCAMCDAVIGRVFDEDYLGFLGPPLHPHDHCGLEPYGADPDQPPDPETSTLDWSSISGSLRRAWVRLAAWILRREEGFHVGAVVLPPILEPLREEAEEYNRERERRLQAGEGARGNQRLLSGEDVGTRDAPGFRLASPVQEEVYMPNMRRDVGARHREGAGHGEGAGTADGNRRFLRDGSRVRLSAALLTEEGSEDRIPMRFVRAGQTTPLRGYPKGVVFTAEALRQGVSEGLFDGAGVFFQHVNEGRDVRDLAGVTAGATFDEEEQAVVGVVHMYGNGAGRELQALAGDFRRHRQEGIAHPDIGVSIDSFFVFERGSGGSLEPCV